MKSIKILGIPFNKRSVVRWKIYIDRARNYLSIINFLMIAFVFLNSIEHIGVREFLDENKLIFYPLIMFLFILMALVLGRLDTVFGMRKEELRNHATENPVTMEILNSLKEIKELQKATPRS